jgi:hypothetical protein
LNNVNPRAVQWTLVFTESAYDHWSMRWLHPRMRHVYAIRREGDYWLKVDSGGNLLSTTLLSLEDYPHIRDYTGNKATLVHVWSTPILTHRGGWCYFNCVEVCKALLGIKSFLTFTPYQLFRRLTNE